MIRIAVPLLVYFAIMWFAAFFRPRDRAESNSKTATMASPRRGTTLSWRSPVSIGGASPAVRRWPGRSARSSRCPPSSGWSTCPRGCANACSPPMPPIWREYDHHQLPSVLFVRAQCRPISDGRRAPDPPRRPSRSARPSAPADTANPAVVAALLAEIARHLRRSPKVPTTEAVRVRWVITMGCGDARPIFPGKRYED